ncbi:MAG: TIGR04282 family arsenosugar biosynthesis glycosyltransferase [Candidatus Omnitrophica bacterium]|nr:TIGR04282 family arsenosugar biosynthesis glycosyltransferase [Candidatus Omnitrophota bacterium]MBI3021130.1 TIGR04282 family arsenosugar biosynthesis glycosyltransferase [Candidatus Omnitrophota bacterium]
MRRLLVFLKYPSLGRVKTRLADAIGDEAACSVYRACVELTLERLGAWRAEATLCVEPPDALERTRAWVGPGVGWALRPQSGGTLGERLAEATAHAFAQGAQRVIAIGTDSPWLTAEAVDAAFAALGQADLVLGPTEDGGYYLIGLSRPAPDVFADISWSTSTVYQETLAKARALGLPVQTLPLGYDVDRLEDLQRFVAEEGARLHGSALLRTIEGSIQNRKSPPQRLADPPSPLVDKIQNALA